MRYRVIVDRGKESRLASAHQCMPRESMDGPAGRRTWMDEEMMRN
jgi:hypothetical protein